MKKLLMNSLLIVAAMVSLQTAAFCQEERSVADFTGINSGGNFNVYVRLGNTESLRLEGNADVLKEIETEVVKGVLKIQYIAKKRYWDWNSSDKKRVNIYITAKTLTNLGVSGSGDMKVEGTIKVPDFRAGVSGSGNLVVAAESVNLQGSVSGSGNLNLSGTAQNTDLVVSGSGNLSASNFKAKTASVTVSGSGNVNVSVEKSLRAVLSGSGNIKYSGNPEVTKTQSGSGRISN
ncbi:MAG: head GIN domain-containing protein [Sphingobacteriaceae bacterium]